MKLPIGEYVALMLAGERGIMDTDSSVVEP
jgi:hypothetical protein